MEINPENNDDQRKSMYVDNPFLSDQTREGASSQSRILKFLPETFFDQIYTSQTHREHFISALSALPPFYMITGDVDDAMLTLSRVLDSGKPFHVLLCTRSIETCLSFLDTHQQVQSIVVAPTPTSAKDLQAMVAVCKSLPTCCGMGLKAFETELVQLFSDVERERLSVVDMAPLWARSLRCVSNKRSRIIIHTHGVCVSVVRSERPIIDPRLWESMIDLIARFDAEVILTGDASLTEVYPALEGMIDMRSATVVEQRACIRSADLFVSSDCPELVIAAMMGLSCVHCLPLRGYDIEGFKNNRLRFTYARFSNIRSVESYAQFGVAIAEEARLNDIQLRHASKAPTTTDYDCSTVPERHLGNSKLTSFHPVFWNRSYANALNVLIKSSKAVGDSLITTAVIGALKTAYPQISIDVSAPPHILDIYRMHPSVRGLFERGSADELRAEAVADEVIEYNSVIDRFPEYYHGLHLYNILANIAGVNLASKEILYYPTSDELRAVNDVVQAKWEGVPARMIVCTQFATDTDAERSYPYGSEVVVELLDKMPNLCFVNVGMTKLGCNHERVLECSEVDGWGLREHIAVVHMCDRALMIDSSFLHVAHNLWSKPTLMFESITNRALVVDVQKEMVQGIRNSAHGCTACYWQSPPCKRDCMASFSADRVVPQVQAFLESANPDISSSAEVFREVSVSFDDMSQNIARAFYENVGKRELIVPVVTVSPKVPSYVRNWNGVKIQ